MFRSDTCMAYRNEDIVKYREARDETMTDLTSAEDEATKNTDPQNKLLSFHEDFDVIGLVHFNWGHSSNRLPKLSQSWRNSVTKSYRKNAIVKKKHALCYLCGQKRLCRVSGRAQCVTPAMLNLRQRHASSVEGSPYYLGGRALAPFLESGHIDKAYFSPKVLGQHDEHVEWRQETRQEAMDHAHWDPESIVPIHELEPRLLKMPGLRDGGLERLHSREKGTALTEELR